MYFQFRCLPSAIHPTAVASRVSRVSSVLAPVIHSTYSRCADGLNASQVFFAFAFFSSAASTYGGVFSVDARICGHGRDDIMP